MVAACANAASGLSGQPLLKTTELTEGSLSRHDFNSRQPARCSCSPGPWLGLPAIKTTCFFSAAVSGKNAKMVRAMMIFRFILYFVCTRGAIAVHHLWWRMFGAARRLPSPGRREGYQALFRKFQPTGDGRRPP